MGDIKDMVGMIPGASKALGDTEIDNDSFKHIEGTDLFNDSQKNVQILKLLMLVEKKNFKRKWIGCSRVK